MSVTLSDYRLADESSYYVWSDINQGQVVDLPHVGRNEFSLPYFWR